MEGIRRREWRGRIGGGRNEVERGKREWEERRIE